MRLPFHRSLAVSIAVTAMLLRALLPDGWMPNSAGDAGGSPFVICSVDGAHGGGKSPAQPAGERSHAPCAFAAAAPLAPPALISISFGAPSQPTRLSPHIADDGFASSRPYQPNAARAPPAFS